MSALKSIALAIEVATRKRDQAGKYLMQAQRACTFAQNQLDQLESYAADSQARWTASAQVSVTAGLLQHHYQFMERLRHAIALQLSVIADLDFQQEAAKKRALDAEFRLAGLRKVMKKKQEEIVLKMNRREQKQMDEFAAMQFARTASRAASGEMP